MGSMQDWWWEKAILYNGHEDQFTNLVDFTNGIDFDGHDFAPQRYPDDPDDDKPSEGDDSDPLLEAFTLTSEDNSFAIGWVHNRTIYWYNLTPQCGPRPQDDDDSYHINNSPIAITGILDRTFPLKGLTPLGLYLVEFYNTTTSTFGNPIPLIALPNGTLPLVAPVMSGTNQDFAYRITRIPLKNASDDTMSTTEHYVESENQTNELKSSKFDSKVWIYPNPSTGKFRVLLPGQVKPNATICIHNALNEVVLRTVANSNETVLDLSNAPSGIYIIRVLSADNQAVRKIILR